jgi:ferritin
MTERMEEALNKQLNAELYSAYMYLSMTSWFESMNLSGFASWMKAQVVEEVEHGMKFYEFINDRGGRVSLTAIEGPPTDWESPVDVFEAAFKHEQYVTSLINGLVNLAIEEKDHATQIFLQWFVTEQVEEEASFGAILERLRMVGEAPSPLFMMDRELGQRKVSLPTTT